MFDTVQSMMIEVDRVGIIMLNNPNDFRINLCQGVSFLFEILLSGKGFSVFGSVTRGWEGESCKHERGRREKRSMGTIEGFPCKSESIAWDVILSFINSYRLT